MGAQFRCRHCRRPLGWTVYCPLRDMESARCVLGDPSDKLWPNEDKPNEARPMTPTPYEKRYKRLLIAFGELQAAAKKVIDETDRIHDSEPWPIKYRAPYGAIVELRKLLGKQYGLKG